MTHKTNERNAWKLRALQARAKLPHTYMVLLLDRYPNLRDNQYMQSRIRNMIQGKLVDKEWTVKLEALAEDFLNS